MRTRWRKTYSRFFATVAVVSLVLAFGVRYLSTLETDQWLDADRHIGISANDTIFLSYQTNTTLLPIPIAFAILFSIPVIWLLRRAPAQLVRAVRQARDESEQHRIRQARLQKICHHCGYDLRASLDRCPECGTDSSPDRE